MEAQIQHLQQQLTRLAESNQALNQRCQDFANGQPRRKDLTIAGSLKEWTGAPGSLPVREFFNAVEAAASMGNLEDSDKIQIVRLKVGGPAAEFLHCRPDLSTPDITFAYFRNAFEERFKEKLPENYHYTQLQTAVQKRDETPEAFADRIKALSLKTIKPTEDPVERRILGQEAERRLIAAYTAGLRGEVGRQVRLRMPQTMREAVQIAVTTNNIDQFRENRDSRPRQPEAQSKSVFTVTCFTCNKRGHVARDCRSRKQTPQQKRPENDRQPQHKPGDQSQSSSQVTCFYCKRKGHVIRDCRKKQYDDRAGTSAPTQQTGNGNAKSDAPTTRRY